MPWHDDDHNKVGHVDHDDDGVVDHVDGEDEYGRYDIDSTAASIFVVILVELNNTVFAVLSTMTMKTGALGEFIL